MPIQDTSPIKEKIIIFLKRKGPSLPVHIAKEINSSILFTSAFLSELMSEKKIKTSNMKVGSSPLYFVQGQEYLLENFSNYLKSKEKEAFFRLKEKKFLKDAIQEPAIRVALREIKDFAIPFKQGDEIIWRFFTVSEREPDISIGDSDIQIPDKKIETPRESLTEIDSSKKVEIFDGPLNEKKEIIEIPKKKPEESLKTEVSETKKIKKKATKKRNTSKKDEGFFNKVKGYASEKSWEILDIINFGKGEMILKIKNLEGEKIFIAYNKRKINDLDIIRAAKKASEFNLPYILACVGEPLKKLSDLISAINNLDSVEKLE